MRLIIYIEIRSKRNLKFEGSSKDLLLLKNSIKNEEVIDLDSFSENQYIDLIARSFETTDEIILIINKLDAEAERGALSRLLLKLKYFKGKLEVHSLGIKLPSFYKQKEFSAIRDVCSHISA